MPIMQTRRRFLTTLSLAGAAGLLHAPPTLAAEGRLETTSVRIGKLGAICLAPQYVSEDLLRAEGFTEIRYVEVPPPAIGQAIGRSEADFSTAFAVDPIQAIDASIFAAC
jgi:NitT/TauT family transport system substrate-binding protein